MTHAHHHHGPGHHHHHDDDDSSPVQPRPYAALSRFGIAGLVAAASLFAACSVLVTAGDALVVSRFGDPVRVLIEPGLRWKLPPPFETILPVDLRLKTTSSGLHDVGTKDGLRILVQAYVAWKVEADQDHVRQYLRAVRNQPNEAASQIRTFLASALETTVSSFELASLINTDPGRVEIAALEERLSAQLDKQLLDTYGIAVRQIGIERLTLPVRPLDATVSRMAAERDHGRCRKWRKASARPPRSLPMPSAIHGSSSPMRRPRPPASKPSPGRRRRASTAGPSAPIPSSTRCLRSLDTLDRISNANTRIFLRTDAAPFRVLIDGPQTLGWTASPPAPQ